MRAKDERAGLKKKKEKKTGVEKNSKEGEAMGKS